MGLKLSLKRKRKEGKVKLSNVIMFTREEKGYKNEKEKKKVKVGKPKEN